jgi:hypothetical protein
MEVKKKHAPFSLFKRTVNDKEMWYARFWDANTKRYAAHRARGTR